MAVGKRGVSVLVMPGDVALQPAVDAPPVVASTLLPPKPVVVPAPQDIRALADLLNGASRVTILGGSGCAGAHDQLIALCARLIQVRGGEVEKPITPRPPYHPVTFAALAGLADADLPDPEASKRQR